MIGIVTLMLNRYVKYTDQSHVFGETNMFRFSILLQRVMNDNTRVLSYNLLSYSIDKTPMIDNTDFKNNNKFHQALLPSKLAVYYML